MTEPKGNLIPVAMDRHELAELLTDIRTRIELGDSFEGNLSWEMPIPFGELMGAPEAVTPPGWPSEDCEFWVHGVYRIGNLQGQGGVRMIGTVP